MNPINRARICQNLEWVGIELDPERNALAVGEEMCISTETSRVKIFVIPTNEELMIARDTVRQITVKP